MRKIRNLTNDEDDTFSPGTDLIIALLAVLLIILVITAQAYQKTDRLYENSQDSIASYQQRIEQLENQLKETEEKYLNLLKKQKEQEQKKERQFPPNITITAAQGYDFSPGSAELPRDLELFLRNELVRQIEENIAKFDVDTVVVIGHTDGQEVSGSDSNLDFLLEEVANGNKSVSELRAGSNTDLGLIRALAVVKKLQEIQKREQRLKDLDPRKGFRVYSAAQLTLPNGNFASFNLYPGSEPKRRRIEIRFTKSDED